MTVEAQHLEIAYRGETFLRNINLKIGSGKIVLLCGSSGYGKTSLWEIMAGIRPVPAAGRVYWNGKAITPSRRTNRLRSRWIGLIFSQFRFLTSLSIAENITLPAALGGIPKKTAAKRLDLLCQCFCFGEETGLGKLDLGYLLGRRPGRKPRLGELSNGQKEIAGIARGLILDTPFVFADEMLRSFDWSTAKTIWNRLLLPELGLGGQKSLFLITHREALKSDPSVHKCFAIDYLRKTIVQEA